MPSPARSPAHRTRAAWAPPASTEGLHARRGNETAAPWPKPGTQEITVKFRHLPLLLLALCPLARAAEGPALLDAAYAGDVARVAELLKGGANPDDANAFGATPLAEAARRGDTAVLQLLLKAGADAKAVNAEGETALMAVARTGNIEAARLLIKHGASVDAREKWGGQTALIYAAAQNQPAMIAFLVSKGAQVDARSVVRDWPRRMTAEERPKDMNRGGLSGLM